jgi:chorismate mutase
MTRTDDCAPTSLSALREEIDDIDDALHGLLMRRGDIIDRLIAVKAREGGGSAFRPAREADMMRRLVSRHAGILPLDTVEGIWRIIISTFTYVQAPYSVHADVSGGDTRVRDSCRFHFGFTVPLKTCQGSRGVIGAVAAAAGDLGLVRVEDTSCAWWNDLAAPDAPKIIARLPFVERADHAAGEPLYVIAKPVREAAVHDVLLHAVHLPGAAGRPRTDSALDIVAWTATAAGLCLIVAGPESFSRESIAAAFPNSREPRVSFIGSHAARFDIDAAKHHDSASPFSASPEASVRPSP